MGRLVVGRVTRITYGFNNRLYAKRETAREILTVAISQTYYSDATAAAVDPEYQSTTSPPRRSRSFSPVRIQVTGLADDR